MEICAGDVVRLHGLSAGFRYNGHVGRVLRRTEDGTRWGVALHGCVWTAEPALPVKEISVRAANLTRVRILPHGDDEPLASLPGGPPRCAITPLLRGFQSPCLPYELALRVRSFLEVQHAVEPTVTACSSTMGQCPLAEALTPARDTWWISAPGTVGVDGRTRAAEGEWLEFDFGVTPVLVSFVGVAIPPLPQGPLSVRQFHLQYLDDGGVVGGVVDGVVDAVEQKEESEEMEEKEEDEEATKAGAHSSGGVFRDCAGQAGADRGLITLDARDVQEFALTPAIVTRRMRLVCTEVAKPSLHAECIGLYEVRFR